jgi:hypothetical protein
MAKRGMAAEGFLLSAWLPKATVARGEQVWLWLTLQNVSDKVLFFQRTVPEADFPLVVQDAAGRTLSPKKDAITVSCLGIEVQPGECLVRDYRLNRMYDFSAPDKYSITATARVLRLDGDGWTDVVADTVILTVTEAVAPPVAADRLPAAILFMHERLNAAQVKSLMDVRSAPLGGFQLTSALFESRVGSKGPVALTVTLQNLSSQTLSCWETSPEFDIGLIVEGPQGALLPNVRRRVFKSEGRAINILPGGKVTRTFDIYWLYDLSAVGEYRITAVRRIPAPGGWACVVSNTVVLAVTPNP